MSSAEAAPAPAELQTPDVLTAALRDLLATINKKTLDPPLVEADLASDKFAALRPTGTASDEYYKTSLETAHKNILYDIAVSIAFPLSTTTHPLIRWWCR